MSDKLDGGLDKSTKSAQRKINRAPFTDIEKDALGSMGVDEALEALLSAFHRAQAEDELTRAEVACILGWNPSAVSRLLNGRSENFTVKSLALLMRAMGHRFSIHSEPIWKIRNNRNGNIKDELSITYATPISGKVINFNNIFDDESRTDRQTNSSTTVQRDARFEAIE